MKWARVENGIVREIIPFNPEGRFTPEIVAQFVVCDETVREGYTYENGVFTEPVPQGIPKNEIELLQEENQSLKTQLTQTNTDFQNFMDFMFTTLNIE